MKPDITEKQLVQLKDAIPVFAPLCLYNFLVQLEIINLGRKIGTIYQIDDVAGLPLSRWPADIKEDYYRLSESLPLEALQNAFAEIHYFLIFTIAAQTANLVSTETQTRVLDALFSVFSNKEVWGEQYPAADAFSKYRKSNNPMVSFSYHLCSTVGVRSVFEVAKLTISVGEVIKLYAQPTTERILKSSN